MEDYIRSNVRRPRGNQIQTQEFQLEHLKMREVRELHSIIPEVFKYWRVYEHTGLCQGMPDVTFKDNEPYIHLIFQERDGMTSRLKTIGWRECGRVSHSYFLVTSLISYNDYVYLSHRNSTGIYWLSVQATTTNSATIYSSTSFSNLG